MNGEITKAGKSPAYVQAIPSDSLGSATVKMIGGKSVVWNQLADDFDEGAATKELRSGTTIKLGNKYYLRAEISSERLYIYFGKNTGHLFYIDTGNNSLIFTSDITITADGTKNIGENSIWLYKQDVSTTNPSLFDLTQMFGAGNEPSSIDDPRIAFIESYATEHPEYNAGEIISAKVDKVVTKDSGDVPISEYPIPAAIQTLPGYGWSAGDAYNYVDFGRKKFVQNVGKLSSADATRVYVYDTFGYISFTSTSAFLARENGQGFCSYGTPYNYSCGENCFFLSSTNVIFGKNFMNSIGVSTTEQWMTYIEEHPVDFYCKLATPIETDISEYITDDVFLDTEVGGAVTFRQQDDTGLEVPNTVEHTVGRWKQITGTFGSLMNSRRATMFGKSVIDTSPRIMAVNKTWTSGSVQKDFVGSVLTEFYSFLPDIDAIKETQYWDEANQYLTADHVLFQLRYYTPSTGVSFSSYGKHIVLSNDETFHVTYWTPARDIETTWGQKKQKPNYCMAEYYPFKVSFNLTAEAKEDSYAYWAEANSTRLMPIGVRNGDVIFAGKNTPYYGKLNIYD